MIICFFLYLVVGAVDAVIVYGPQPRIICQDGHLTVKAAEHKNITFQTQGSGRIHINGIDLTNVVEISDNTLQTMRKYHMDFGSSIERISKIERLLEGQDGKIQQALLNSSSGDTPVLFRSIRRLNTRLNALRRRVITLTTLLNKDECGSSPCLNGGTCQDLFNAYSCICPKEWEGSSCEKDVNECVTLDGTDLGCQNGATCRNKPGSYTCVCPPNWFGVHCTKRTNDCNQASGRDLCGHGTCIPQNNDFGYKCICDQGWKSDGSTVACNTDVDECTTGKPPCSVNPLVQCINLPGSFRCGGCPLGYTGSGFYCLDIDECAVFNGGCSMNPKVQCVNIPGSRICGNCPPGFIGDGVSCSYQGVCSLNNGGCHPLARCEQNTRISSSYVQCICPPGYTGTGIGNNGCIQPQFGDVCASSPCIRGTCLVSNLTGQYICICNRGYTGLNCDRAIDRCVPNPCQNGGTCANAASFLGRESYTCRCPAGFKGINCQEEIQACGGRLRTANGTLVYPALQSLYEHSISCAWTIETNITKVLNITFVKFNIEKSRDCQYDWLQIHDGRNTLARSLGRFCGTNLPNGGVISSTHNVMYLWFRSDHSIAQTGFELNWQSIDPICGENFYGISHGQVQSPGSPFEYPDNRDCFWTISVAPGKRILFHFFSLLIGNDSDCDHDYLELFSGHSQTDPVIAKFCNSSHPAPLYSSGPEALIHFHSDASENYLGFQITFSEAEGIPGCGGVYTMDRADISSPAFSGKYPPDIICEYKINLSPGTRIKLTFTSFALELSENCQFDYVAIYSGLTIDSPIIGRYCGRTIPQPYTTETNNILVVFKTDWSLSDGGFVLKYETICGDKYTSPSGVITSPKFPRRYNLACIYEIVQPVGTSITLSVTNITLMHTSPECALGSLDVRDGDNENSTLIGQYCDKPPPLIISTHNYLWIKFSWDAGDDNSWFQASYNTTQLGCGGIIKDKVGTVSTPSDPEGYPSQTRCEWVLSAPPGYVVQIGWMNFHVENSYKCEYDYVEIYDNNTETGMGGLMGRFCGHTSPPMLLSTSNLVTIIFNSDSTVASDGFLISYTYIQHSNVCGGNYYTSAGTIKSPGYPDNYPVNIECTWTINVQPGHQIMLNVTDFDVESYSSCRYDWLEIRNGGNSASPTIGKFCGKTIPKLIPSHTNKLYLHFKSDMTKNGRGFNIKWDATQTGCGGTLTAPSGSITSPHYPEPYSRNLECSWKISVSAGSTIQIIFADLDLEDHPVCTLDYIAIYDGLTSNSNLLGRYCNVHHPPVIKSTSNHMLIKFVSDISQEGRGFQLQYFTMCNNTLTGYRGVIESPNFPYGYPHNQNCIWNITVADRNKINITFSHFELELYNASKSCSYDFVEIKKKKPDDYDDDSDFITFGTYCGNTLPPPLTLNSDRAQVVFVTDNLLMGNGFRLEWQLEGCGGILTHEAGKIQSPDYPKSYPPSIKCEWSIQVDYGSSIDITFSEIDVEKESDCDYDYVKIHNGKDATYPELAKICHQTKPITISSSGNFMFVEFKADASYQGKGFVANYSTKPTKCGGKYTAIKGRVMSPNYPQHYDKNDTCGWLIETDNNHVLELIFEDVDLISSRNMNCSDNNSTYIKVFDGPSAAYPVLAKVCDRDKPNRTLTSTYNYMYIELITENTNMVAKGFLAKYRKSCGARIETSGAGSISLSPRDLSSDGSENCTWTIVSTDLSKHVSLTITYLDTSDAYCEEYKPLKIYNGESAASPLLGEYCGTRIPPTLTSDGSALHIVLQLEVHFFATYSVFDSACGGELRSMEGSFGSPGYPKQYPIDAECEWTLAVAEGNQLTVTFNYFKLLDSGNCNTDYLEMRQTNNSGKLLGVYCGDNVPSNLTNTGSLWAFLKTSHIDGDNSLFTAKGFLAEYSLNTENQLSGQFGRIASPLYPKSYTGYGEFSWTITVDSGKKILLSFKEFYVEIFVDNSCYFTRLEIYDGVDITSTLLGTYCGLEIPNPIKSSSNKLHIVVYYSSIKFQTIFMLEWKEIDASGAPISPNASTVKKCGSKEPIDVHSRQNYTVITSPGYPTGYQSNLECEWIFSTIPMNHLRFWLTDINLEQNFGRWINRCYLDYIEIYQKKYNDADWQFVTKICDQNFTNIIYTTNLMRVVFKTNRYINGTGFSARVRENCGGTLTDPSGIIYFDNSTTNGYGPASLKTCQWNITVKPGRTIEVTFLNFNINQSPDKTCSHYLLLRNGKFSDSPLLGNGRYCGSSLPPTLTSVGNHLYLKFLGGYNELFKLSYREVLYNCGGRISLNQFANSTTIKSPNYPEMPPSFIECVWIVTVPPHERVRVDFVDRFDLHRTNSECTKEYVEIRDGGTPYSPLVGRFCKSMPGSQNSRDNIMFIKFFTDAEDPGNGFKATVSIAKCGGTIRSNIGRITSNTDISDTLIKNLSCTWYLVGPLDHTLTISITKMDLPPSNNCTGANSLTISEEDPVFKKERVFGKYCGHELPMKVETSSNEAKILFQTDHMDTNDGFTLSFNSSLESCGGTINAESGFIQSPGYPAPHKIHRRCQWKIVVPRGRRVTLEILDYAAANSAIKSTGAGYFNGPGSSFMGLVSPSSEKKIFRTSENQMTLFYWSNGGSLRGFKAKFYSNEPTICDGDFSQNSGVITQPKNFTEPYYCTYYRNANSINSTLALSIKILLNTTSKGYICKDAPTHLAVTTDNQLKVIAKYCRTTSNSVTVRTPLPNIKLIAVQILNSKIEYTVNYNVYNCGGLVSGEMGTINSPGFPNKYPTSLECSWLLTLPVGQIIKLTSAALNLGRDCDKSYIDIYNGNLPSHPKLARICQGHFPDSILSQSNSLWIDYKADKEGDGTGFSLKYEPVMESCGGTFHDRSRVIQTPQYPKNYPNNAECLWEIRANEGFYINLKFISRIQLEQSPNCQNDFVEIWDWKDNQWASFGKMCGREINMTFSSTSNKMKLLFRSNNDISGAGFRAQWSWHCGGTFVADRTERFILSPGYPEAYDRGMTCNYNITAGPMKYIYLKFYDFHLEKGVPLCKFDNLTISNVARATRYNHMLQVYCGTTIPPDMRLTNTIYMTFSTDNYIEKPGFRLSYQLESCGGDINTPQLVSSPALNITRRPGSYYGFLLCTWNITAPPKRIVAIQFEKFHLPIRHNCYFDNVDIMEGVVPVPSSRIANLCGDLSTNLPVIKSKGNQVLMRLRTDRTINYGGFRAFVYFPHGPAENCGGIWNISTTTQYEAPKLGDMDCTWTVIAPVGYYIKMRFTQLVVPMSCNMQRHDSTFIEIKDGMAVTSATIEKICNITTAGLDDVVTELTTSGHTASIRLFSRGENNATFKVILTPELSICGPLILNATDTANYLTSPNYPNSYPSNLKCTWFIKTATGRLVLHFEEFDLTEKTNVHLLNNSCAEDRLIIIDDPNNNVISDGLGPNNIIVGTRRNTTEFGPYTMVTGEHQFCGKNELPFDYYSNKELITVTFSSGGASLTHGKGFKLQYQTLGCNRNFTSNQGRIVYNKITDCYITVTVSEGYTISLFIQYFLLYQSTNCEELGIQIHDGGDRTGNVLLKACGYAIPDPIFSTKNKLWIHAWNRKTSVYAASFDMVYTSSPNGRGCGGTLYNYKGRFTSPLYPREYKENTKCQWEVLVPLGMRVAIKFNVFDMQGNCESNYLKVTTYQTGKGLGMEHKFCAQDNPAPLYSTSRLLVEYQSSTDNGGRGWTALFEAVTQG